MPVVLGVVEPAVVEVAAEVVGACSVAVVEAAFTVGVDGVVLNEQQTKLLYKKILNCLPKIKKFNSQKMLPTGVTVFEPAALSGGGIWKKNYFNKNGDCKVHKLHVVNASSYHTKLKKKKRKA